MNSTSSINSSIFVQISTIPTIESWFIPIDILMIVCTILVIIFATLFIFIIVLDKTCHTIPMMLTAHSCLADLVLASDLLSMTLFTLKNDFQQIRCQDSLCVFRGYLGYVTCALQNYSNLLQALYRYINVVYPIHSFWQTARIQTLSITLIWIFAFGFCAPFLFTNEIIYNIRYVKGMRERIIPKNTLLRAQRELKMVRRICILVIGVTTIGFPYALFIFISFSNCFLYLLMYQ